LFSTKALTGKEENRMMVLRGDKKIENFVVTIFFCFFLSAFNSAYGAWEPEVKFLTVFAGTPGGGWQASGAMVANLISEAIPQIKTTIGPGGAEVNCKTLEGGRGMIGLGMAGTEAQAYYGLPPFDKPHRRLRHLVSLSRQPHYWIVRMDSDITKIDDLKNRSVAPGKQGQVTCTLSLEILKAYGMTPESIKANGGMVHFLGTGDRGDMLRDKHIEAMGVMGPFNEPLLQDLSLTPGIRLIGLDEDKANKVIAANKGLIKMIVPKGTLKGQKEDKLILATLNTLMVRDDMSEELAYRITKAILEGAHRFKEIGWEILPTREGVLSGNEIPVHPGAMRYIKESLK
jgi:hypothetical protein